MIGEVLTDDYQNIPRYYTALAEWICCMLPCFFLSEKSRQGTFCNCGSVHIDLDDGVACVDGRCSDPSMAVMCTTPGGNDVLSVVFYNRYFREDGALLLHEGLFVGRVYGISGMAAGIFCS